MGRGTWYKKWLSKRGFMIENIKLNKKSSIYTYFPKMNQYGFQSGNIRGIILADTISSYQRMTDLNVLFPIGFHSLGSSSFLQSKKKSNLLDDEISDIFHNQMIELGIGINKNKLIDMRHDEFLINLQLIFLELYEKGYIKYKDTVVYYDQLKDKIYDEFSTPSHTLPTKREKCFVLDIKDILNNVLDDIDKLMVPSSLKEELKNAFKPKFDYYMSFNLSNDVALDVKIDHPEYLGSLSAILINPDLCDITNFISYEEKDAIEAILSSDEGFAYSGLDTLNPLTGSEVPVFISRMYDEGIHLCFPAVDEDDYAFTNECELDYKDIIGEDNLLYNSDFLDGLSLDSAHEKAITNFMEYGLITKRKNYKINEILLSSSDSFGPLFPFLYDAESDELNSLKNYLPYSFSTQFRPITKAFNDVAGMMLSGTINNLFVEGMTPFITIVYDVYSQVDSFFSESTLELFKEWMPFELFIVENENIISELLMPIIFYNILKKELKFDFNLLNNLKIIGKSVDNRLNDIRRSNNNLIDMDKVLKNYYSDSIRLFALSDKLSENFIFNGYELKEIDNEIKKLENALINLEIDNNRDVDLTFLDYKNKALSYMDKYDLEKYIKILKDITNKFIYNSKLSKEELIMYLKLIYPITPYLAENIYEHHFDVTKSIINESW